MKSLFFSGLLASVALGGPVALFNGADLSGWRADVPAADNDPAAPPSFIVRDGKLVSMGVPLGHLITERVFSNYRLTVEYRFPGEPGNCGVLVHTSKPRVLGNLFPQSIEVQMMHGNAGDFWCIGENIEVPDMEKRRPRDPGQKFGGGGEDARRILNLTDDSENPPGEWNVMEIECKGAEIKVWVNGDLVNHGSNATADRGKIAIQAEGTEVEFRKLELSPLAGAGEGAAPANPVLKVLDPAASALVAADVTVEKLGGGLGFTEGPVWLPAEKALVFADIPAARLMRWTEAGGVEEYSPRANPNGSALDARGLLLTCQHGDRNIVRREPDGTLSVIADRHEGKRFNSPNDVVVKSDGSLWFTDPTYGLTKDSVKELEGNWVFRLDPASGKTTVVNRGFDMPNGIAFSPDEKQLYISDTGRPQRVGAFPVREDGTLGPALWWAQGGSDGMKVDEKGNLYTTAGDGLRIYSSAGKHLATIAVPEQPANCAFGGDDFKTLFITARSGLYRVKLLVAGNRTP